MREPVNLVPEILQRQTSHPAAKYLSSNNDFLQESEQSHNDLLSGLPQLIKCRSVLEVMKAFVFCLPPSMAFPNSNYYISESTRFQISPLLIQNVRNSLGINQNNENLIQHNENDVGEQSILICDLAEVQRQFSRWKKELPTVQPFYAVKCHPDANVVKLLANLGANFDCASKSEMKLVLSLGVDPSRIIFAHPCKSVPHLRFAAQKGIRLLTFDNVEELLKIKAYHPHAQVVLRIRPNDNHSLYQLGRKFGASMTSVLLLLKKSLELNLEIIGVSFHVGSGCYDAQDFPDAVVMARQVFDIAESLGIQMQLLDIGGGFPGNHTSTPVVQGEKPSHTQLKFETISAALRPVLAKLFPNTRIISEPGRYFVSSAFTLSCMITSRRVLTSQPQAGEMVQVDCQGVAEPSISRSFMYYLNDGVYGNLSCVIFDEPLPEPEILTCQGQLADSTMSASLSSQSLYPYSLWGPTCDSVDCIIKSGKLPELFIGDWIIFRDLGAYSNSIKTQFNGFPDSHKLYVLTES